MADNKINSLENKLQPEDELTKLPQEALEEEYYIPNLLLEEFAIEKLYTVHYFRYNRRFKFEGEKHNFWELVYVDAGKVGVIGGARVSELAQGEVIFHKPNEYHNIFTSDNFGYTVIVTFECLSPAMKFFENKQLTLNDEEKTYLKKIVDEANNTYVEKLNDIYLKKMNKKTSPPFGSEQAIKSWLSLLLISLTRSNALAAKTVAAKSEHIRSENVGNIIDNIKKLLEENVCANINLDFLSQKLFFSKTYLKVLFKEKTGNTIIHYFSELKIEEAKKLISLGFSFTDIAEKLQLNSVHYFSRLFKLRTGLTPTEYKQSIKAFNLL